jgi:hypothetical protein
MSARRPRRSGRGSGATPVAPPQRSTRNIRRSSNLSRTLARSRAVEAPSEAADGEEAGMPHPCIAVVVTTAPIGAAASPAASRTAAVRAGEVAEGQAALREATSEASTGLAGRLNREPTTTTDAQFDQCSDILLFLL